MVWKFHGMLPSLSSFHYRWSEKFANTNTWVISLKNNQLPLLGLCSLALFLALSEIPRINQPINNHDEMERIIWNSSHESIKTEIWASISDPCQTNWWHASNGIQGRKFESFLYWSICMFYHRTAKQREPIPLDDTLEDRRPLLTGFGIVCPIYPIPEQVSERPPRRIKWLTSITLSTHPPNCLQQEERTTRMSVYGGIQNKNWKETITTTASAATTLR